MKKIYFLFILIVVSVKAVFAKEDIHPTIEPALFTVQTEIKVTYDVTGTPLANLDAAYLWVWIPGTNTDAKYNVNPASSNATLTNNAKLTKNTANGKTTFTINFKPSDFFTSDISSRTQLGMLLKGNDWSNGQTVDHVASIWDGSFQVKLLNPVVQPVFISPGESISIQAETPVNAKFELFKNNVIVDTKENIKTYAYNHSVTETSGETVVKIKATSGANSSEVSFSYIISGSSPLAARPTGVIPGINYYQNDASKVTLCLWAPGKSSVYAMGDFSNWQISQQYLMNKDGEYFWIEISGLNSGEEYAYQYLVDEYVRIADPYADKILDPDDQYIPATSYPNLKPYPQKALTDKWFFNRVSVFQTGQQHYQWQVQNFQKPPKEELVIYELLIRDFFGTDGRTYKNLTDTISYLKRLGVNAVELMPIMEFNGNDSWGYNPTFKFAPDKYYGPKNDLKAFIDKCHQEGIAVILDIVMNHHDAPNPYVLMDFDFATFRPTATNKWFNITAKHPFNVFFDMNHESSYTKAYLDTVNHYWLHEYKVDGFRYDLSKGFTQTNSGENVGQWSQRDDSRIALIKRMADKIWSHSPDAYIILEHFADNSEEKELAEYRANEGKGMMLWGNLNHAYNQNTMGYSEGSDIKSIYHGSRSWTAPHLIGYMESHDEERLMYKNLTYGASSGNYDVKNLSTALKRTDAAGAMFYLIPGPKMIWQFGEFGYDQSINLCSNGTISNDCRVSAKPTKWEYLDDPSRLKLFNSTVDLLELRKDYPVFTKGTAEFTGGTNLVKQVTLISPNFSTAPTSANEMSAKLVANFGLTETTVSVDFPHGGNWYDYFKGGTAINKSGSTYSITLQPGDYKLFTDYSVAGPVTRINPISKDDFYLFPNPTERYINLSTGVAKVDKAAIWTITGQRLKTFSHSNQLDMEDLPAGIYVAEIVVSGKTHRIKIIKK